MMLKINDNLSYFRLTDVLHKNLKLTMVFEYIDQVLYTSELKALEFVCRI